MRCVRIHAHGGPEQLQFDDVPEPPVGPDEVRVSVRATSINHMDIWVRQGLPGVRVPLPIIPGVDAAGVVETVGEAVRHVHPGDRVTVAQGISCGHCAACLNGHDNLCKEYILIGEHRDGADAELLVVPGRNIIKLAPEISFESAAAAGLVFLTAWQMLVDKAQVRPGETVVVHGAGSGVGSAAIQIAHLFGARVIATTSSERKADQARLLGAAEVILYNKEDVLASIRRMTDKRGADIVIDHVGTPVWEISIKGLTKGGRLVTCGATAGYEAVTDLRYVFYKQLSILGSTMGRKGDLLKILGLMAEEKLRAVIHADLPLEEVREAHRIVESGEQFGKVVLKV
ncbi:MAG: zinc-binding dehydrogenase [Bacteroidetes bacterium]|jgi:NADPH:quinone reductase-like Zn-dependent oxidoreductase|nr:zinc-binding dehydrogenase [Bacteroidota bacterium]